MGSVLLVHGWGGSFATTWQQSGFTALLDDGGKQVIGVDMLGHGDAPKPHETDAYADLTTRLFEAIDEHSPDEPVDAVGFSLGAITLLRAAIARPERFGRIVLAGVGQNVLDRNHSDSTMIADGLASVRDGGDPADLDTRVRLFVQYAQQPGNDLTALTAVMQRPTTGLVSDDEFARISCPVLVVVGDQDFCHPGDELASKFSDGSCVTLPRVDHFATTEAFGFFDATLEFLGAI